MLLPQEYLLWHHKLDQVPPIYNFINPFDFLRWNLSKVQLITLRAICLKPVSFLKAVTIYILFLSYSSNYNEKIINYLSIHTNNIVPPSPANMWQYFSSSTWWNTGWEMVLDGSVSAWLASKALTAFVLGYLFKNAWKAFEDNASFWSRGNIIYCLV